MFEKPSIFVVVLVVSLGILRVEASLAGIGYREQERQ